METFAAVLKRPLAMIAVMMLIMPSADAADCARAELAVQVLGSGGPIADDGRASSGYLIWVEGHARVLVDAGSGTFVRFGEAGARFADLEVIALSHFHTDHVGSLPALLKTGYFSQRSRPLTVVGPAGSGPFPGLEDLLNRLLNRQSGAFGYLSGYLSGSGGLVQLKPVQVALEVAEPAAVFLNSIAIEALPVPHGIVPSLAYRVRVGDRHLVFGSDQNGSDARFVELARDADLLVLHAVIPDDAGATAKALHATPAALADIVAQAEPRRTVLSHWMARSLAVQDEILRLVGDAAGAHPVISAEDLTCVVIRPSPD